jgi:hypothetical protein
MAPGLNQAIFAVNAAAQDSSRRFASSRVFVRPATLSARLRRIDPKVRNSLLISASAVALSTFELLCGIRLWPWQTFELFFINSPAAAKVEPVPRKDSITIVAVDPN